MRRQQSAAFTLLETIFSSLFLGVTVLAIVNLFPGAYMSIRQSESTLQADFIAESILDDLRARLVQREFRDEAKGGLLASRSMKIDELDEQNFDLDKPPYAPKPIGGITYTPSVDFFKVKDCEPQSLVGIRVVVKYASRVDFEKTTVHETYLHAMTVRRNGAFQMTEPR